MLLPMARRGCTLSFGGIIRVISFDDIPKELLSHSLSDREIVLPYPDVISTIHRLPRFGLRLLGWEGWLRYADGRIGHSAHQQGTLDLCAMSPIEASEFCIRTIEQAHAEAVRDPEPGELYFCITVNAEPFTSGNSHPAPV
jgi:hypothetical protein